MRGALIACIVAAKGMAQLATAFERRATGLLLCQVRFGRLLVDANQMIAKRRENIPVDTFQTQRFGWPPGHVTVNAVLGKVDSFLREETTITFTLVAVHASTGKQLLTSAFIVVRVVAIGAGHFRLLKADALCQPIELVAGVNAVLDVLLGVGRKVVLVQLIARTELQSLALERP